MEQRKLIYKKDLLPINNLKVVFREIRDYFAGNVTGITRDEKVARNIINLLLCKIYDEKNKKDDETVEFGNRPNEDTKAFYWRISNLFELVKKKYSDIIEHDETIEIESYDLSHIVSKIESYSLLEADRDVFADAFEEFIGTAFRGGEGQFFTPRNVVQMMIDVLQPQSGERIVDPACGSGGFLSYILRELIKNKISGYLLTGIEKDLFLSKLAKIYLALLGQDDYHVFCENSLDKPEKWNRKTKELIRLNSFDLILTNPPFGARIPVVGNHLLKQYELGHYWKKNQTKWHQTKKLRTRQPPQILFIERIIQLLKKGGRAGIILPEGIFGNPSKRYVWDYIRKHASVIGVVSLSQQTFQPSTHIKTSVIFLEKRIKSRNSVFMAIADSVGHNKNGKEIYKKKNDGSFVTDGCGNNILDDDTPAIAVNFKKYLNQQLGREDKSGFTVLTDHINENIFIPESYNPEIKQKLSQVKKTGQYQLVTIGELVKKQVIHIKRGNEVGSQYYGTGDVPFVRTTDIVNWEINMDPVKAVSELIYNKYKEQQDVRTNDILFVNDGTFLIGRSAIITRVDKKCIIQSHLRKIRVLRQEYTDPFYLFYLLNSRIVQKQIAAHTFVQATLSTLGNRILEIVLPIHTDKREMQAISNEIREIIEVKTELREKSIRLVE
ncbi:MAG: N-6 DNA methylase, partial [Desulfobacteraceae bacterium]|nr:N-6 DNA methylase [Desulfobacteraceae bacterium]